MPSFWRIEQSFSLIKSFIIAITFSLNYEREQKDLKEKISHLANTIDKTKQQELDLTTFIDKVKKYTEIKELTPEIINKLIDKIYVYQQIDILVRTDSLMEPLSRIELLTYGLRIRCSTNWAIVAHKYIIQDLCQKFKTFWKKLKKVCDMKEKMSQKI